MVVVKVSILYQRGESCNTENRGCYPDGGIQVIQERWTAMEKPRNVSGVLLLSKKQAKFSFDKYPESYNELEDLSWAGAKNVPLKMLSSGFCGY